MANLDNLQKLATDALNEYKEVADKQAWAADAVEQLNDLFGYLDVAGRDKQAVVRKAKNNVAKMDKSVKLAKFYAVEYQADYDAAVLAENDRANAAEQAKRDAANAESNTDQTDTNDTSD